MLEKHVQEEHQGAGVTGLPWIAQVPDEPGAAEAPPEVRERELPGVHAGEAVCAEAAHGDAEAAAGDDGAQGG